MKIPIHRIKRRWDSNVDTDLKEIGCESADWIYMAQDTIRWEATLNTVVK
jgi:hypothetical protein